MSWSWSWSAAVRMIAVVMCVAATGFGAGGVVPSFRQPASSEEGLSALHRFRDAVSARGWNAIEMLAAFDGEPSPSTVRVDVDASGDFFYRVDHPRDRDTRGPQASYYVALSNGKLHVGQPPNSRLYETRDVPLYASAFPGPVQWDLCPWPVIPRMCEWLETQTDLTIVASGDTWIAESNRLQFRLRFRLPDQLIEIQRGARGSRKFEVNSYEYSDAHDGATPKRILTGGEYLQRGTKRVLAMEYSVLSVAAGSGHDGGIARFDPGSWRLQWIDHETGDVFGADGGFLYNRPAREKLLLSQVAPAQWRTAGLVAAGCTVLLAILLYIRRIRKGAA